MFAGWTLDETTRDLIGPAGQRVDLTSSEFDLLMAFLRHPGQPLSRAALLGALRGREWTYFDRSIDTMVARLRKKLDDGSDRPPLIRSVRGVGYVFCAAVARTWRSRPIRRGAGISRPETELGASLALRRREAPERRELTATLVGSSSVSGAVDSVAPVRLTPREGGSIDGRLS